nr:receptor-like protein kinase HERK 1 [Tanacetum cinerariifolium]
MALVKELEHLKISLDVIKLATNSFGAENFIGVGGFGKVYKGEISDNGRLTKTVAIKRLDRRHGQGDHEFLTEIMMLSRYRHKNLVSLIGFCDEDDEKILVYEYEFNGSLEKYLSSEELTWSRRLKICIGAARGLEYLHNPLGTQQRVLHRDVKCANFLLDQNWEAKISDFGLSRIGPANQEFTFLVSTVVGTLGYCDPLYAETVAYQCLKRDREERPTMADVLSALELASEYQESYESGKPMEYEEILQMVDREHTLVYTNKRELISLLSSGILVDWGRRWFSLSKNEHNCELISASEFSFEDADMIEWIPHPRSRFSEVAKIESARELHIEVDIETIFLSPGITYAAYLVFILDGSELENFEIEETGVRLVGILVDWGRRWFSLSKNEHNCELISASEFSFQDPDMIEWIPHPRSRFSEVAKIESAHELNIEVDIETIFLSPGITYAAYLVFILDGSELQKSEVEETWVSGNSQLVGLTYKLKEVSEGSITYLADITNNGWMIIELCQFICYKKVTKLEVFLESTFVYNGIVLEGIQFLPIEKPTNDESVQVKNANIPDTEREQKLPDDYRDIIKMAKDRVPYNITNKDLYLLLSNGILINKGQAFFYLDKDGIKCNSFRINCHINSHMLSPNTAYAIYLVYTLPENNHGLYTCPLQVQDSDRYNSTSTEFFCACLVAQETHVINTIKDDGDHSQVPELKPLYRPKIDSIPKERKDGWMEVQIWNCKSDEVVSTERARFVLSLCDSRQELTGLIVQGIEIRPL